MSFIFTFIIMINLNTSFFILIFLSFICFILMGQHGFDNRAIAQLQKQSKDLPLNNSSCIVYDSQQKSIMVSCKTATLTDLYNHLKNPNILNKQPNDGVWLLNSNITINPGATLNIDPSDTTWLKIISDEKTLAYVIHVKGSLKIDSVSLTSWNPSTNNFALSYGSRESSGGATSK